jgi:glycosyltransferase involved in cell wall biosynthesis
MIVLSHPNGNANLRAIAVGLEAKGLLYEFNTTIAAFPDNFWHRLGGINILSDFRRRSFNPVLQSYTICHPFGQLGRAFANKVGLSFLTTHETGRYSTDQIYQRFDKQVSKRLVKAKHGGATAVYAYEDGALETFLEAKKLGLKCIYDLPIAYHETLQNIMQEEEVRRPEWSQTLGGGVKDSSSKLLRKKKELELADTIVVASDFVRNSLPKWALSKKIIQSPFGTPATSTTIKTKKREGNRLRVLFAGSMTQRKGLADLFDAIQLVDQTKVELVVLGSLAAPMSFYSKKALFTYEKTRSHREVLELMNSCDVFCLPSLVEGRALVMQEAMSQGLPIIITPNTGGEDLVIAEVTGFLVPVRNPEAIALKIMWFIEHRSKLLDMKKASVLKAQQYSWESYANNIINQI